MKLFLTGARCPIRKTPSSTIAPHISWLWVFALFILSTEVGATTRVLDDFAFPSVQQARHVWVAQGESPAVAGSSGHSLTFALPFDSDQDRAFWDRPITLDLSQFDTIELDLTCDQPESMRSLAIYFKSGDGWYIWNRPLRSTGRQTVRMMRAEFQTEGTPAGWHQIERIRISPWRGAPISATLTVHQLRASSPSILILRHDQGPPDERAVARRASQRISQWLDDVNLSHAISDESTLTSARLHQTRILILPYNPTLPTSARALIRTYINRGGKVMALYSSDAELATWLGFRLGPYQAAESPGRWSAIRFQSPQEYRTPQVVYQDSWNIRAVHPATPSARVIAEWLDASGARTGDPAWTVSAQGLWMSHILLQGDDDNKRFMIAALLAHLHPPIWRELALTQSQRSGRVGPYPDFQSAVRALRSSARRHPARADIERSIHLATEQQRRMQQRISQGQYAAAVDISRALRRNLVDAYARTQWSQSPEWRAVWDHRGTGLYPGDWERTARLLTSHGINAVLANVLWGGLAHYNSDVLPRSATVRMHGDQLELSTQAGQRHQLAVHAWIVCWDLTGAPPEFMDRMRQEGRLIQRADGSEMRWLNPAHPANVQLMVDSLVEVANRYPVQGIHLDYIRYPDRNACYAPFTRQRFEEWLGRSVPNWPADAQPSGSLDAQFRRFRADQITLAVRAVHRAIRRQHPDLTLSAAVWGGYPAVVDSIGQDWPVWLERGYLDFVTPMNYASDYAAFMQLTRNQMQLPQAQNRIRPGIGVTAAESQLSADQVIRQILGARSLGATGWVLFDLNNTLRAETLPTLSLGVTR